LEELEEERWVIGFSPKHAAIGDTRNLRMEG
jgi:hypothetical protein